MPTSVSSARIDASGNPITMARPQPMLRPPRVCPTSNALAATRGARSSTSTPSTNIDTLTAPHGGALLDDGPAPEHHHGLVHVAPHLHVAVEGHHRAVHVTGDDSRAVE